MLHLLGKLGMCVSANTKSVDAVCVEQVASCQHSDDIHHVQVISCGELDEYTPFVDGQPEVASATASAHSQFKGWKPRKAKEIAELNQHQSSGADTDRAQGSFLAREQGRNPCEEEISALALERDLREQQHRQSHERLEGEKEKTLAAADRACRDAQERLEHEAVRRQLQEDEHKRLERDRYEAQICANMASEAGEAFAAEIQRKLSRIPQASGSLGGA